MGACYFSTIAQLVERMTVNHDVTGSNPVDGVYGVVRLRRAIGLSSLTPSDDVIVNLNINAKTQAQPVSMAA